MYALFAVRLKTFVYEVGPTIKHRIYDYEYLGPVTHAIDGIRIKDENSSIAITVNM
jgi:hypothetical protein